MRTAVTVAVLVSVMLGALACAATEIPVTRVIQLEVTREVEVPVEVIREVVTVREIEVTREVEVTRQVEVTREVVTVREIEVTREVEVTRQVEVTREVEVTKAVEVVFTATPTPLPTATPTPAPTPTPTVDVRDVDYVRDIEIAAEFVAEAAETAAAYCDNRTFSVSHDVNYHFHHFFFIKAGTDECRADALAAMAVRSKRISEAHSRYIFQGNKFRECHADFHSNSYYSQGTRLQEKCDFMDLYPARHSPDYDREKLIVLFEDQPPEYPFDYLLTQDELWARDQIWRSLVRFFHLACIDNAESTEGRVLYFDDRGAYIGHLPNVIDSWFSLGHTLPAAHWGTDGPNVGLCSAYDIKIRALHEMWEYDLIYFGYLATGLLPDNREIRPGSNDFTQDLAAMRSNPPESPNRFAAD